MINGNYTNVIIEGINLNNTTAGGNYIKTLTDGVKGYAGGFVSRSYFGSSRDAFFVATNIGAVFSENLFSDAIQKALKTDKISVSLVADASLAYTRTDVDNKQLFVSQLNSLDLSTTIKNYTVGFSCSSYRTNKGKINGFFQFKGFIAL